MIALCIVGGLVLLVLLVLAIRVGCQADYSEKGLFLWLTVGALRFQLLPTKPKQEKKKKRKRQKKQKEQDAREAEQTDQAKPESDQSEKPGKLSLLLDLAGPGLRALGQLRRKLRVELIRMNYVIGGADDPAQAAVRYGIVSAGGGALIPLLNEAFDVRNWDLHLGVDFDARETRVTLAARADWRVGQVVRILIALVIQALPIYRSKQKKTDQKEEHKHGRKASDR